MKILLNNFKISTFKTVSNKSFFRNNSSPVFKAELKEDTFTKESFEPDTTFEPYIARKSVPKQLLHSITHRRQSNRCTVLVEKMGYKSEDFKRIKGKKYFPQDFKQRVEDVIMPFFDKEYSWLPTLDNGRRPNVTYHGIFRLLERFILDTKDIEALTKPETKEEVKNILTAVYTQKPIKTIPLSEEKGGGTRTYTKYDDYIIRAMFNKQGYLVSIYKEETNDQAESILQDEISA